MCTAMSINQSFQTLSVLYKVPIDDIKRVLDNTFTIVKPDYITNPHTKTKDIILPFCGVINENCCKAIVYNHGLYTQCPKETTDVICKICSKLKYGRVEERIKYKIGCFVTPDGKKEIPYTKFISKMNYNIDDVKSALKIANLVYDLSKQDEKSKKKGRGRPKKIQNEESDNDDNDENDENEEIEVTKIEINGTSYFKTSENILLNIENYQVEGIFKNNTIQPLED
jgi:hypothetical protein